MLYKISSSFKRCFCLFIVGFLLVSCGLSGKTEGTGIPSKNRPLSREEKLFNLIGTGLSYIDLMYVRQVDLAPVAISGLNELQRVDPNIRFQSSPKGFTGYVGGFVQEYRVSNRQAPGQWALASALAIQQLKSQSPRIAYLQDEQLYELLFDGYTSKLDRFSSYLNPQKVVRQDARFLGFGGLGINLEHEARGIRVVRVIERTPAQRAGIRPGDLINGADGFIFGSSDMPETRMKLLKGEVGSRVRLAVLRKGQQFFVDIERDTIVADSVSYELKDGTAHITLHTFNSQTARRVEESLLKARQEAARTGGRLFGIILDVRDNGGGLRTAVIEVADLFLKKGIITRTRGRIRRANKDFMANSLDKSNGLPVAILVNGSSASASELLASGLQDNGRGLVVGSTSFGKGSVQSKFPLPNGGDLALTTAEFFGPSGIPLQEYGVVPTICTSDNLEKGAQVARRLERGGIRTLAVVQAHLLLRQRPDIKPEIYRNFCPPSVATPDRDYDVAAFILKHPYLYQRLVSLGAGN